MDSNKRIKTTMGNRLEWMKKWLILREYSIGKSSKDYLFIYYCTLKSIYDGFKWPVRILWRMNQKLDKPLDNRDFRRLILKYEGQQKAYKYSNEKIISILGITPIEVEQLLIGKNKKEVSDRAWRVFFAGKQEQEIIQMYQKGHSTEEISVATQVSVRKVQKIVKPHREELLKNRRQRIEKMSNDGMSVAEIAKEIGCSGDTVRRELKAAKTPIFTITEIKRQSSGLPEIVDPSVRRVFCLYREECKHSLVDEDQLALAALQGSQKNIALLGAAGTGKSTIARRFLDSLPPDERAATLVVAPTGKAASHLGATTIHKAFRLDSEVQSNQEIKSVPSSLLTIDRLIIDEANMLRIDIFDTVMKMVQFIENKQNKHIQVILLADFGQLQPVATKADEEKLRILYPNSNGWYVFQSEFWTQMHFEENKIILMHIHRQSDPEYIELLERIKYGDKSAIHDINRLANRIENPDAIYLCPTKKIVDSYNHKAMLQFDVNKQKEYAATISGNIQATELPCPELLSLAVGMRIMTVCNTTNFNNGSFGTIKKLLKKSISVVLDNGNTVNVGRHKFKFANGATFEQIPVVLAYAITINKAEGCQFDELNLVPGCFTAGMLYTALSRCTSLQGIHLLGNLKEKELIVDRAALAMTVKTI